MNRKFLGLAPLLAIVAFAVVPVAAQALPQWTVNKVLAGSEPVAVTGWGTLTLTGTAGNITCHNAAGGSIDNVAGEGRGLTQVFSTYDCESTTCPAENSATAVELPRKAWPSHLIAGGPTGVRSKTEKVKVTILCTTEEGKKVLGGGTFFGSNEPAVHQGTSALHPGFIEFDPGSGELELEPEGSKVKGKTEGEARTIGYEEQELIGTK